MGFRPRVELASAVGRDFERLVLPYFQLVFPDISRPTPLAAWDRKGVDIMTTPEHDPIEVCVQCKSTLKPKFELDDIKSLKDEIDKFIASGTRCVRYILALNRSDFDGQIQKAVEEHRTQLPDAPNIEVWELAKIVNEAQEAVTRVIRKRVKQFNDDWREQLIGRFAPSGAWVRKVPARTYRMMLNWEDEPELRESVQTGEIDVRTLMLSSKTPHMGF